MLRAYAIEDPTAPLRALLDLSPGGIDPDRFDIARNLADPSTLAPERAVIEVAARRAALAPAQWASILDALRGAVARHHAAHGSSNS